MYLALYRKYRPSRFSEMVGQEYVIKTLRSQVKTGRISHAYLFCGLRGTGKTTAAKIFAAAINCPSAAQTGEPCLECDTCRTLAQQSNLDIIEIDAASNNGVDQIRELRDKVVYPPQHGKYKVYIIDEVHMLTGSAFNAMLKTLEEPPSHAVFILATTEPQKLPSTVLSRCQRFDFKHISTDKIVARLKTVLDSVGADADENALRLIASVADGGMRDALSLADMCLSYETERPQLTYETTLEVLGTTDRSFLFDFADALIASNAAAAMEALDRAATSGKNLNVFLRELMSHLRDVLLIQVCKQNCAELLACDNETYARLEAQAKKCSPETLMRAVDMLSETETQLRLHSRPRILLELALLRICRTADEKGNYEAAVARIDALEQRVAKGVPAAPVKTAPVIKETTAPQPEKEAPKPNITVEDAKVYTELMRIIKKERIALLAMLKACNGGAVQGETFVLEFPPDADIFIDALNRPQNKGFIEEALERLTGRKLALRCRRGSEEAPPIEQVYALFTDEPKKKADAGKYEELFNEKEEYDEFIEEAEYHKGEQEEF